MPQAAPILIPLGIGLLTTAAGYGISQLLGVEAMSETSLTDRAIGTQVNTRSTQAPLPLIYGTRVRVGVNQVYINTRETNNGTMDVVGVLGEGEITGIVREDGTTWDDPWYVFPTENPPLVYFDHELWTEWGDQVQSIRFYSGTSTQGVSTTVSAGDHSYRQALRYTAYLVISLEYKRDGYNQFPNITATVNGLKVYNAATGVTASTTNAAVNSYDFLTRNSARGGMGVPAGVINTATLVDSIEYCDTKKWTFNAAITQNDYAADNLNRIMQCFRGKFVPTKYGESKLLYRDLNYESVCMALTSDDIVDGTLTISQPDVLSRPNAIRVKYYSKASDYQLDDYVFTDSTALAEDGDYREMEIELLGINTLAKLQEAAYYYLERARNSKLISFTGGRNTIKLEIEDLITLTHGMPVWTAQKLRVIQSSPDQENLVNNLTCVEESTEFYDTDYDHEQEELFATNIMSPNAMPPSISFQGHIEEVYDYRGKAYTRWLIYFDPPSILQYPWWDHAEVWVKKSNDAKYHHVTNSLSDYEIAPVYEGETYSVIIASVSKLGKRESLSTAWGTTYKIKGKTNSPDNLAYLTAAASGSTVNIYSTAIEEPDIDGYEVRLGSSWIGGLFISYNKAPSVKLVGVRPGTHTFWMSPVTKSVSGQNIYSGTPVSATCKVFIPPGYTSVDSTAWDFDSIGTHQNTEHDTYSTADVLKCSHEGSVLTGMWESPVVDLGSAQDVKVWADFETVFSATAATVEGIAGTTLTTENINGDTITVADLLGLIQGGLVEIEMFYSTNGSTYSSVNYFEVFSADVNARYLYVQVTITDPSVDSNMYVKTLTLKSYSGPQ